jgi:hypothetical protein
MVGRGGRPCAREPTKRCCQWAVIGGGAEKFLFRLLARRSRGTGAALDVVGSPLASLHASLTCIRACCPPLECLDGGSPLVGHALHDMPVV